MDRDFEGKIRSRIEAILINDARNYDEMRTMSSEEEPLEIDPFAEERNLYQRIINNYRNAMGEVNSLLEENLNYISGLCRIVETIKDKDDFQEICLQVIDCVLQDLGAEFCGLVFNAHEKCAGNPLFLEGVREQQKLLFSHSHPTLLGSREFAQVVEKLIEEDGDCQNIGDVYRDPRFNSIDFPSVVRSLICLPIVVHQKPLGALVLSHSLPRFFTQNHARVLKILASTVAHLLLLTDRCSPQAESSPEARPKSPAIESEALSMVLVHLECDGSVRRVPAERELTRNLQSLLSRNLEARESLLHYDSTGLLILLPGTPEELLFDRASRLRSAFEDWKNTQGENGKDLRLSLGYATCANAEELTRTLEAAAQRLHGSQDENESIPAEPDSPQI
jgi:hypothetical protein